MERREDELRGEMKERRRRRLPRPPVLLDLTIYDVFYSVDPETRKLYEDAVKDGVENDKTIRVMLVGCYGQGKTTLVRRLLGEPIDNINSTDGIEVHRCISRKMASSVRWTRGDISADEDIMARLAAAALVRSQNYEDDCGNAESGTQYNIPDKLQEPHVEEKVRRFRDMYDKVRQSESQTCETKQINVWDFGGQFLYYTTHQMFHSRNAVYLLLFNLNVALEEGVPDEDFPGKPNCRTMKEYLIFWMQSIHAFVGSSDGKEPVVILVGTHRDEMQSDEEAEARFDSIREIFGFSEMRFHIHPKHFALSLTNENDVTIQELKKTIVEVDAKRTIPVTVPAKWIVLEDELKKHSDNVIITISDLHKIDDQTEYPIKDEAQLKLFLKYHHNKGNYIYFDEGEMADYVVLKPQFVIDAFRSIIKSKRFCYSEEQELVPYWVELSEKAVLKPELIQRVWADASGTFLEYRNLLLFILQRHRIIAQVRKYEVESGVAGLKPQNYYVVPSLLKRSDDGQIEKFLRNKKNTQVALVYKFQYSRTVGTMFQRMLAAAVGTWPLLSYKTDLIFDNVGVFEMNSDHAALIRFEGETIELRVVQLCTENDLLEGMGDYLRRFAESVIHFEFRKLKSGLPDEQVSHVYDIHVRCLNPDHRYTGSEHLLPLRMIQENYREFVRCPDNESHTVSLNKNQVQKEWFQPRSEVKEFPARTLASKELSLLSQAIGKDWQILGVNLGLHDVQLEQIDLDYQGQTVMKIYKMLMQWSQQFLDKATFDVLVEELRKLPKNTVIWDIVYNVKDEFY